MKIWVVTDGSVGMLHQALGLAEALRPDDIEIKTIRLPWIYRVMPSSLYPLFSKIYKPKEFNAPWPDFCISCGRRAVLPALTVKRLSQHASYLIHIQDPRIHPEYFDIVIALQHDNIMGKRVIKTYTSLHPWTQEKLQIAQKQKISDWKDLPLPYTTFLIGGDSKGMKLTKSSILKLNKIIEQVHEKVGGSILLSLTRRTPKKIIKYLSIPSDIPHYIYKGGSPNPYLSMITQADRIFVTDDSISMMSEVTATQRPIFIIHIHKGQRKRFDTFKRVLLSKGIAKLYNPNDSLALWEYKNIYETSKAATYVLRYCKIKLDFYDNDDDDVTMTMTS